jgi:transposase-like protein
MRAQMVRTAKRKDVQTAVRENVEPGSFVMTDTLPSYIGLQDQFIHMAVNHALQYAEGRVHTNGLENFWSLMKRTLRGTYVACEPFHLQAYLDEQVFRFNNRELNDTGRFAAMLAGVTGKRLTLADLVGKTAVEQRPIN